jgi:hypothetical protein
MRAGVFDVPAATSLAIRPPAGRGSPMVGRSPGPERWGRHHKLGGEAPHRSCGRPHGENARWGHSLAA